MTTVLDDVLRAEQTAEAAVAEAKTAAQAAEAAAMIRHTEAVQSEQQRLASAEEKALADFETELSKVEVNMTATIERDVASIAQQFSQKKDALVTLVTNYFA